MYGWYSDNSVLLRLFEIRRLLENIDLAIVRIFTVCQRTTCNLKSLSIDALCKYSLPYAFIQWLAIEAKQRPGYVFVQYTMHPFGHLTSIYFYQTTITVILFH